MDTVIASYANPQSLNRYSYVLNNPLRYTDLTGHKACGDGEEHDCNGNKQDPNQNPHLPKPHKDKDKKKDSGTQINWNAVVDPLAWSHIAEGIVGGVVVVGTGVIMIAVSVDLCVGSAPAGGMGCAVGIPVGLAGVGAIWAGSKFIWSGIQFTKIYLNDIFEVAPSNLGDD